MHTRLFALVTLTAALAACSSLPDRNSALDQARINFNAAQSNPQVATLAPNELKSAGESLRAAEQTWTDGGKPATVDHLAYLSSQRVVIARDTASSRAAELVTTNAAAERDKLRLDVRTLEADRAQRQLAIAEQANAQKASELAAADAAAQRDQAQARRRDEQVIDLELQLKELNAKQTERGMVVTLGDVLFDSGKSQLLPGATVNMAKLAGFFSRNPQRTASIEGYTDSIGNGSANQALSQRRADAVMTALVQLGVRPDRLSTRAFGEEQPVASNDTVVGRQMNRRVEIVFAPDKVSMK